MLHLTIAEYEILLEALDMAASRHESAARYYETRSTSHEERANRMRRLRHKIREHKVAKALGKPLAIAL